MLDYSILDDGYYNELCLYNALFLYNVLFLYIRTNTRNKLN